MLKQAFGPDYREFAGKLLREEQLARIGKVGGGSQTFARMMQEANLGQEALQDIGQMAASAKAKDAPALFSGVLRLYNRIGTPEAVRNEMGRILMLRGDEAMKKLSQLAVMMDAIQKQRIAQSAGIGVGSAYVAPQLTRGMNQSQTGE